MSFILDALRRSENERQRHRGPDLVAATSAPRAPSRNVWLPIVGLLAGINLSLLIVLWFMGDRGAEPAAPAPAARIAYPMPEPDAALTGDLPGNRDLLQELEEPDPPAIAPPDEEPARPPAPSSAPAAAPADPPRAARSRALPSFEQLVLDGAISVGDLHLDLHVYSREPRERFVFINTARYAEGDRLQEGPAVLEITEAGVVLQHQGRDFLLTRD